MKVLPAFSGMIQILRTKVNCEQCSRAAHISLADNLCETVEKLGEHYLILRIKVILPVISHTDIGPSNRMWSEEIGCDEKSRPTFLILYTKAHNSSLIMRKGIRQNQTWGESTKYIFLTTVKVRNRESLRNVLDRGDQGDMGTKCNGLSWMGICYKGKH